MPKKDPEKLRNAVRGADRLFSANDTPVSTPSEPSMQTLKIDPEFKSLIPKLSDEEYEQLVQNLRDNKIREPISIWGDVIIDGHNRYVIAQKYGLPYTTVRYEFESKSDVILWIIKNQFGRRNLTAYDRSVLALRLKPVISEKAKEQQIRKSTESVSQNSVKQIPIDTQRELAEIAGVSHDTISKVEKIEQVATPDVLSKLKRGEISIHKAYQDIKKQEKLGDTASSVVQPITHNILDDKYDVIYCDCPLESFETDNKEKSTHYPVMKLKDIMLLEIPIEDNAILFMWTTATILTKALQIMAKWGFVYHTCTVWDKQIADKGQWFRSQHELLLIGVKGNYSIPTADLDISSVHSEKRSNNSKKPEFYYNMIEKICPDGKYLEVFAQKKHNSKWTIFGNPISEEVYEE